MASTESNGGEKPESNQESVPDGNVEGPKAESEPKPFIEKQPIREDQIENAVKFLSHPKVRGSPVVHRRSFLERKGLSKEEIDEAFRRVPDPPSSELAHVAAVSQGGQQNTQHSQNGPPQSHAIVATPEAGKQAGTIPLPKAQNQSHRGWPVTLLAAGFLAAAGAGASILFKTLLAPKLKEWIHKESLEDASKEVEKDGKPNPLEVAAKAAAAAASSAAAAATEMADVSREMMKYGLEERKALGNIAVLLKEQNKELKSTLEAMNTTVHSIGKSRELPLTEPVHHTTANGGVSTYLEKNGGPDQAPHSHSYMEVLAMVERGEKPPGIKEVNDKPPNPNQQPTSSQIQPKPKPWMTIPVQSPKKVPARVPSLNGGGGGYNTLESSSSIATTTSLISDPSSSSALDSWWRRKTEQVLPIAATHEPNRTGVKITEIETNPESGTNMLLESGNALNVVGGRGVEPERVVESLDERNVKFMETQEPSKIWTPPPVPAIAMPGASAAIRYQKSVNTEINPEIKPKIKPLSEERSIVTRPDLEIKPSSEERSILTSSDLEIKPPSEERSILASSDVEYSSQDTASTIEENLLKSSISIPEPLHEIIKEHDKKPLEEKMVEDDNVVNQAFPAVTEIQEEL